MFGSLRIAKSRLTEDQRESYRGHFCGSCHAMRDYGGRLASLLTNYDQTVLAIVLGGLTKGATSFRPCTALPFRQVPVTDLPSSSRDYLAALNFALVGAKLIDDVQDGDHRLLRRGTLRLMRSRIARAHEHLHQTGFPVDLIASLPARQAQVEESAQPTLKSLAAPSAQLTGEIFAHAATLAHRPELRRPLLEFGSALGRFVYLYDAYQDLDDDRRRGRFNALDATSSGARCSTSERPELHGEVSRLRMTAMALPLGEQGALLGHLVDSLEHRVSHHVAPRSAQAGDCDCGACDLDCSTGGGDSSCCDSNASCCTPCDCCYCHSNKSRKAKRRQDQAVND